MVDALKEQHSPRLLKHIVRCFLRISDHAKGRELLRKFLPPALKEPNSPLINDENTRRWLSNLHFNINGPI